MNPDLILLLGPTGTGKTALALALAEQWPATVLNADSRQVYADFPLITAQPSLEERAHCPHLLYGFLPTGERITAGFFVARCRAALDETLAAGRLPLLVGGTGLYVRALLEGLAPIPAIPPEVSAALQAELQARGLAALHQRLERLDPPSAARIHPNDPQRTLRALEVLQATGHTLTWWHQRPVPPAPYRALKLGLQLPLEELTPLLARRIEAMLAAGALDEARAALARCPDPTAPGWSGIGCAELLAHLQGRLSLTEAKDLWLRNTRAYAKRQLTWFRKDPDIHWFRPDAAGRAQALATAAAFLAD